MPLYRYKCESCGSEFTVFVRQRQDNDAVLCPECGSNQAERVVSRVAIQFKGSGYYKTDYARRGKTRSAGTAADNSKTTGATAEKKPSPDTKADSNTEGAPTSKPQHRSADKGSQPKHKDH